MNALDEAALEAWRRETRAVNARGPSPEEIGRALAPDAAAGQLALGGLGRAGSGRSWAAALAPLALAAAAALAVLPPGLLGPAARPATRPTLARRIVAAWPSDAEAKFARFADLIGASSRWGREPAPKESP